MIQSILVFCLGFLCAAFLALLAIPRLTQRAARLARRRIEATMPLSRSELEAEKDSLRAEYAMTVRRLEINLQESKDKAAMLRVELGRYGEQIRALAEERDEKARAVTSLQQRVEELEALLAERDDKLEEAAEQLARSKDLLDERSSRIAELDRLYEEASFAASTRQIELVARESEIEKLSDDLSALRNKYRENERLMRQAVADRKTAEEALRTEKERSADLEAKLERLMTAVSDRDEKLERRERELAELRERMERHAAGQKELAARSENGEKQNGRPDSERAQMSTYLSEMTSGDMESAVERVAAERDRLEARLKALARENKRLRRLRSVEGANKQDRERQESAALREEISDLAAEVVHLASRLEGPGSSIARALEENGADAADRSGRIRSLADRVRALQRAANAGPS